MTSDRKTAVIVGVLFIVATVALSLAVVILQPILGARDYLASASLGGARVGTGVLLELINHIAVVGIAVVIYPVLKRFSKRIALGYVAARSIEAALFAVGTMHLLALVTVSREFVAAGAPQGSHFQVLGSMLLSGHDWDNAAMAFIAFGAGTIVFNYALYRTRLVPRWLSAWGLVSAALIVAARIMVIYGIEPSSSVQTALDGPIALQEMALALWLIVKGFSPSVVAPEPEGQG